MDRSAVAAPRATYVSSRQVSYTARNAYTLSSPPSLILSSYMRAHCMRARVHTDASEPQELL